MTNFSKKNRRRLPSEKGSAQRRISISQQSFWLPARPRPPRPRLLALAVTLYGVWLILLLLLAALA